MKGLEKFMRRKFEFNVSYVLILINIIMFIITLMLENTNTKSFDALYFLGQKDNLAIMNGEYWRLVTPMFLHLDIMHIAFNCYSLFAIGPTCEMFYGKFKFIIIYFVSGVFGSILSFMFSTNPSVGASGAIFGIVGALLYATQKHRGREMKAFKMNLIIVLIINLGYGFTVGGIDNFGHIGGLIGGYLSAIALGLLYFNRKIAENIAMWVLIVILGFGGMHYGLTAKSNMNLLGENYVMKMQEELKSNNYDEVIRLGDKVLAMNITDEYYEKFTLYFMAFSYVSKGEFEVAEPYVERLRILDEKFANEIQAHIDEHK